MKLAESHNSHYTYQDHKVDVYNFVRSSIKKCLSKIPRKMYFTVEATINKSIMWLWELKWNLLQKKKTQQDVIYVRRVCCSWVYFLWIESNCDQKIPNSALVLWKYFIMDHPGGFTASPWAAMLSHHAMVGPATEHPGFAAHAHSASHHAHHGMPMDLPQGFPYYR